MKKFYWPTKKTELKPISAPTKSGIRGCNTCGLHSGCKSPQMAPHGEGKLKIVVCAECPGAHEDSQGIQLIGDAGQLLRSELSQFGVDLDKDCTKTNSCRCRTPSNRKPTNLEIECCKRDTWQQVKELQPKAIWLLGSTSIKSFFWDFESGEPSINKWRGWCIPNHEYGAYVFPMYHPSYVLRNPKDQGLKFVFHQDIANAVKNLNRPFPKLCKPVVHKLTNKNDIETVLRQANEDNRMFTFDYETTGLKPYKDKHSIVYAGFSRDGKEAWAFPFEGNEKFWKQILLNSEIPKVAHNMKFEELWSREILNVEVQNWIHCTMLCAHVLDDRSEITNLRFQIMARYGELTFKNDSDPFLKAPHGNDFNNIRKAPLDLMLQRVGDDAGWEARLYYDQIKELKSVGNTGFQTLEYGYNFFHEGSLALVDAEQTGMKIKEEYLVGKKNDPKDTGVKGKLEKEIAELKSSIVDNRYVKQFFGGKFNPKSDVQLKKLLYTDMRLKPTAFTAPTKAHPEGTPKVDKASLEWIAADKDHPMSGFVSNVLQFKKQSTLHSTFVVGLMNEVWDGSVHSFYNLHLARTFRSTSNMVNFQNIPMRDKENSYLVRSAFYPYIGHQLLEADFCLSGETEIESITGKRNIIDIIENYKNEDIYVYCYNLKEKRIGISKVIDGKQTGTKKEVWKVILDNGESVIATPEHKFMLRTGNYKELKDLVVGQSLMPLYKRKSRRKKGANYERVYLNNGKKQIKVHNLIALDVLGIDIVKENLVVHHINGNGLDNSLENLAIMDRSEHMRIHVNQSWEDKERKTKRFEWHRSEEGREHSRRLNEERKETWTEEDWRWWKECLLEGLENRKEMSGENNGMWRYNWSDEQKKQMSETKTGIKTGKPAWNTGLRDEKEIDPIDSIHKKKGTKGRIPWNKGKKTGPQSEEHKQKRTEAIRRIANKYYEEKEKKKNHKVVSIEFYGYEDVYNITVEDHHNFAVSAGVIVKNSGIEVRVACAHVNDPVLAKYIKDPTSDMHRDQAQNLFLLDSEQVTKTLRYNAKNQFVFPEFYGSWFGACAENLWNTSKDEKLSDGTPLLEHLAQQRIRVYNDRIKRFELKYITNLEIYTSHVQAEEENFWERFKVYKQWKEDQLDNYYATGIVPMYFGFRRQGHLGKNKILNTSIQGTAFHCLLWCFIRLNNLRRKFKWKSLLCGQIHDSIVMSVHPDEKDMILKLLRKIMTQDLVNEFDWLNIPLDIEVEMGQIDEPWSMKKEVKF